MKRGLKKVTASIEKISHVLKLFFVRLFNQRYNMFLGKSKNKIQKIKYDLWKIKKILKYNVPGVFFNLYS